VFPGARLSFVEGPVRVERGARTPATEPTMVLKKGDTIVTGQGGRADVSFVGNGVLRVGPESRITLSAIPADRGDGGSVALAAGKVFLALGRLAPEKRFSVSMPTAVAGVRGTAFICRSAPGRDEVAVAFGAVRLSTGGKDVRIPAGRKAAVTGKGIVRLEALSAEDVPDLRSLSTIMNVAKYLDAGELSALIGSLGTAAPAPAGAIYDEAATNKKAAPAGTKPILEGDEFLKSDEF
jgi:hypothetical protein